MKLTSLPVLRSNFNSIKVRLEPRDVEGTAQLVDDFNSIKVRLERKKLLNTLTLSIFQFHKGTIRTPD